MKLRREAQMTIATICFQARQRELENTHSESGEQTAEQAASNLENAQHAVPTLYDEESGE